MPKDISAYQSSYYPNRATVVMTASTNFTHHRLRRLQVLTLCALFDLSLFLIPCYIISSLCIMVKVQIYRASTGYWKKRGVLHQVSEWMDSIPPGRRWSLLLFVLISFILICRHVRCIVSHQFRTGTVIWPGEPEGRWTAESSQGWRRMSGPYSDLRSGEALAENGLYMRFWGGVGQHAMFVYNSLPLGQIGGTQSGSSPL